MQHCHRLGASHKNDLFLIQTVPTLTLTYFDPEVFGRGAASWGAASMGALY